MPSFCRGAWPTNAAGRVVTLCAAGLLAAGCGGGATPWAPAAAPATAHAPPRQALEPAFLAANRTMAAGVPVGDSAAPVETRFDVASVPTAGQAFSVRVAVMPGAPVPVLRLDVAGTDGLTILYPDGQITREKVAAGSVVPLEVRAQTATVGASVLYVKATLELPDGPQTRAFAFPILVGQVAAAGPARPPVAAKPAR